MTPKALPARAAALSILALAVSACNPIDLLFPEDPRLGSEAKEICVGRVRAAMTYEEYQQLENAPGEWVPSYTYDITLLDLEAIQELIATGADDTAGTRLMQKTANTSAAVEAFRRMKVDERGALFLGRDPALYRLQGRAQPANTILASGCEKQGDNMRLTEVVWVPAGAAPDVSEDGVAASEDEMNIENIPNAGGVR